MHNAMQARGYDLAWVWSDDKQFFCFVFRELLDLLGLSILR